MPAVLPAALLGVALSLLLIRPDPAGRLRALTPKARPRREVSATSPLVAYVVCGVAGLVVWIFLGGVPGLAAAGAVAAVGPRLLATLDHSADDSAELAGQVPLALDLLGACLVGGAGLPDAVIAVGGALGGPVGERLDRVAAALAVGSRPAEAFGALGDDQSPAGAAARALTRAAEGGTPVAAAVRQVAEEARHEAAALARQRARKVGVKMAGPLGACFLPAFVVLSVVPTVIGLLGSTLRGF